MRPPAPRTAWQRTQPWDWKIAWPRTGSPNPSWGAATPAKPRKRRLARPTAAPPARDPVRIDNVSLIMKFLLVRSITASRSRGLHGRRSRVEVALHSLRYMDDGVLSAFLDLPNRDDGEELREDGIQEDEHGDEPREQRPLHPRGGVGDTFERQPWPGQARHDDEKTLEPHANLHRHRGRDRSPYRAASSPIGEQHHRHDETGHHHDPEVPGELSSYLRHEDRHVRGIGSVERGEKLGEGEVEPQERHHQKEYSQIVEVYRLEKALQVIDPPDGGHGDDDRGDSGENRADDEVRAEDGRMPHGLDRHGEDPGDHGVDRDRDGDHQDRHGRDEGLQDVFLPIGPRPSQREKAVEPMTSRVVIPEDRDVGDERQEEVDGARRKVHADGRDVPEQRRSEVGMLENV